jgi:digeranylgeranylglycerophospholipid reductase
MDNNITIAGLGIAGSRLASLLARSGFGITAYDPDPLYRKPCGEAVPVNDYIEGIIEEYTRIKAEVDSFKVLVDGVTVYEETSNKPVWYIIDKSLLVRNLRSEAESNGARFIWDKTSIPDINRSVSSGNIIVDARGPFSSSYNKTIPVYRMVYKPKTNWSMNEVLIEFDSKRMGFYWIFPSDSRKGLVNAGGGFYQLPKQCNLTMMVNNYVREKTGIEEIKTRGASLIRIKPVIKLFDTKKNVLKVGESAGFLMSITGEGIRPALLSADILADSIIKYYDDIVSLTDYYTRNISFLVKETILSTKLFSLVEEQPENKRFNLLANVPSEFWRRYFQARLSLTGIVLSALKEPSRALRLLPFIAKLF